MLESKTELDFHGFNPIKRDGYDSSWPMNLNYKNYRAAVNDDDQDFLFSRKTTDDPTGVCSPPLWKTCSPPDQNSIQPTARSQAIARGQWELMEMVRNMPESCYELSLKDLVENPRVLEQECLVSEKSLRKKKKVKLVRIGSIDNCKNGGLFLKLFFPFSLGGSKKKKKKNKEGSNSKVSPRPENLERSSKDRVERDWRWMNRFWVSHARGNDDGSRNRKIAGLLPGCWSFLFTKKEKRSED
ncbi:uncharacterized protein LOC124932249 [Impatiens glandulifera]|uniref:uncharacterized protein LOC124932249 n=1 Tax=Impatiens glandulifera TaxID=253017 RepID=UPI001FB16526|nr:uncharacterized protein LOC124932249 [Impatiens glandulifera]